MKILLIIQKSSIETSNEYFAIKNTLGLIDSNVYFFSQIRFSIFFHIYNFSNFSELFCSCFDNGGKSLYSSGFQPGVRVPQKSQGYAKLSSV